MFDVSYFKIDLAEHLDAVGANATVEVHLVNGHTHRVRLLIDAAPGYVVFEAYRHRVDGGRTGQHWQATPASAEDAAEVARLVVAYESIAEIVITPTDETTAPRIGFLRE